MNPLAAWLEGYTIVGSAAQVPQSVFYKAFHRYCSAWGIPNPSNKAFGSDLRKLRPHIRSVQRIENEKSVPYYVGIGLKP